MLTLLLCLAYLVAPNVLAAVFSRRLSLTVRLGSRILGQHVEARNQVTDFVHIEAEWR